MPHTLYHATHTHDHATLSHSPVSCHTLPYHADTPSQKQLAKLVSTRYDTLLQRAAFTPATASFSAAATATATDAATADAVTSVAHADPATADAITACLAKHQANIKRISAAQSTDSDRHE